MVRRGVEFPKTHDIDVLVGLLRDLEPVVSDAARGASWLTPFGVEIRYPGDSPETFPGDDARALNLAQKVRAAVRAVLDHYLADD